MAALHEDPLRLTEAGVQTDLHNQPHLMLMLAQNALSAAESLRDNYFHNTTKFIVALRKTMHQVEHGQRAEPLLTVHAVERADWSEVANEVVTFIDGGVGRVPLARQMPILLRVGSYTVRTGERNLAQREQFGYYPVILGDLEGGSKDRRNFPDIVRITAELLGGLAALERTPNLRVLMFHGPLVYLMGPHAGHKPFTERDIDRFLHHYAPSESLGRQLKEDFLHSAKVDIYPRMTDRWDEWVRLRLFEPLAWIAFLYRRLIDIARHRKPMPIIAGVVEQGDLREFSERVLLDRVFRNLRQKNRADYFNAMYGRSDLNSPRALLQALGYSDPFLLALLLRPGQYCETWPMSKYDGLHTASVGLPNQSGTNQVEFAPLKNPAIGFPRVQATYVMVSRTTVPLRVEFFTDLGKEQIAEAARRVYLYAQLLPRYGFPVGLDVVDKYAQVPAWMTRAYGKLIRHTLGVSLQQGEISDRQMRDILVQAIYLTHRDFLFRPKC